MSTFILDKDVKTLLSISGRGAIPSNGRMVFTDTAAALAARRQIQHRNLRV